MWVFFFIIITIIRVSSQVFRPEILVQPLSTIIGFCRRKYYPLVDWVTVALWRGNSRINNGEENGNIHAITMSVVFGWWIFFPIVIRRDP